MSDSEDREKRIGLWITGAAAGLSVLSILFYGIWGWENGQIEGSPTYGMASGVELVVPASGVGVVATSAAASDVGNPAEVILNTDHAAVAVADDASVMVENGIVKFYFATGKSDLAQGANEALVDVLNGVKEGKKAVVSGFHDSTGNVAQNEELSKQRALSVRDTLLALGAPESQIELRKPVITEGSGTNADARRVEVVLE